jgi:hypothetical protein
MDVETVQLNAALEKSGFYTTPNQLTEVVIDELLDLALKVRGETRPDIIKSLPIEKRIVMIQQIAVSCFNQRVTALITLEKGPGFISTKLTPPWLVSIQRLASIMLSTLSLAPLSAPKPALTSRILLLI